MNVIETELGAYGRGVAELPRLVALNKIDLPDARERAADLARELPSRSVLVSAVTGEGIPDLIRAILEMCPPRPVAEAAAPVERRIEFARTTRDWSVAREDGTYRVRGDRIERLAGGIDWDSPDAAAYFQGFLVRSGIERELRSLGVQEGDTVRIGKIELEWQEGGDR
jgi:GTP-binding protein